MADWTKSMQQYFEYYYVNPATWANTTKVDFVKSCNIKWDLEAETLGSASLELDSTVTTDIPDEFYIRVVMVVIQNGTTEKFTMGTFMGQAPSSSHHAKLTSYSIDMYTPLMELKQVYPPIGYSIKKNTKIMDMTRELVVENSRLLTSSVSDSKKNVSDFVADPNESWLSYLQSYMKLADYHMELDEDGRIIFVPFKAINALQPKHTFNDDNSSILYSDFEIEHDLFDIPNEVEVIYSQNGETYRAVATNTNADSPVSTVGRGRKVVKRITNPDIPGEVTRSTIADYAKKVLAEESSYQCKLTFKHGYYPVKIGDCIAVNFANSDYTNIRAKIISQSISCVPGCPVEETVVYERDLWGNSKWI